MRQQKHAVRDKYIMGAVSAVAVSGALAVALNAPSQAQNAETTDAAQNSCCSAARHAVPNSPEGGVFATSRASVTTIAFAQSGQIDEDMMAGEQLPAQYDVAGRFGHSADGAGVWYAHAPPIR